MTSFSCGWKKLVSILSSDPLLSLHYYPRAIRGLAKACYFPCFFFASASRSVFFRRRARFLALSLPLLFPIS
jgi:hypothetical protein